MKGMGRGKVRSEVAVRCQKMAEIREWKELPWGASSCQEMAEIGAGGKLPGASSSCQEFTKMGGEKGLT